MSKYIDADLLRKEIERQKEINKRLLDGQLRDGCLYAFNQVLSFLDSLSEQPVLPGIDEEGIPGKDFIPVEWVDACERYGKWKIVSAEQPVEGLEEEMDEMWLEYCEDVDYLVYASIARHFAEWGRKQVLQDIYDGKCKPVDRITSAWLED